MLGRRAAALLIAGWTLHPLEARACAVCIGWMGGVDADWAYYWSALLLTLLPFAVVAVVAAWVRHAFLRSPRRDAPAQPPGTTERG
jgi:heme exporter protein D